MNFPEHAKAGLMASALPISYAVIFGSNLFQSLMAASLVFIGAIFPDLDTDSIPARWAARIGLAFSIICLSINKPYPAAILGSLFFLIKSGKHRGFIHKYWFVAACLASGYIYNSLCYAFAFGLLVHFSLDKISVLKGENWF